MNRKYLAVLLLVFVVCLAAVPDAFAGPGTGGKLPYEGWVRQK